mmetsp:Transcript_93915/g.148372  ORF Transcript_93915/g.148372 Transcript_93915/m.148372 type:complete len:208 (-) Transcript_93915:73-696(-)
MRTSSATMSQGANKELTMTPISVPIKAAGTTNLQILKSTSVLPFNVFVKFSTNEDKEPKKTIDFDSGTASCGDNCPATKSTVTYTPPPPIPPAEHTIPAKKRAMAQCNIAGYSIAFHSKLGNGCDGNLCADKAGMALSMTDNSVSMDGSVSDIAPKLCGFTMARLGVLRDSCKKQVASSIPLTPSGHEAVSTSVTKFNTKIEACRRR